MVSPAQRHRLAHEALVAAHNQSDPSELTAYQQLQQQYIADKTLLKNLASMQDKLAYKAQALPKYQDWLNSVLQSGQAHPNDTLTPNLLIWQIDCGQLGEAMPLAQFAMEHNLQSSDEYQRNLPTIIVEQYAEQISQGAAIALEHLNTLVRWATEKHNNQHTYNIPDAVRAKLLKIAGEQLEDSDPQAALALYQQALGYNDKVGVKKQIEALRKSQH
ncbi:phage terminase small subunit [Kingella sp. (in: b-proteobacteria)]|uniref:phage terminase small subunit n=1 Tax=Kingella sp. (in: b-proteobacteria) TaxID=2020713 RepID=UPI0026DAEC17|nr:phage terminase small subunit [Kingella sp. (in: b-proteobacteria)]MDO4658330.1 phage terminase small subunit [Kingella sp. (in: b-proteobacteria)]